MEEQSDLNIIYCIYTIHSVAVTLRFCCQNTLVVASDYMIKCLTSIVTT